ncbi:probable LRR receptor-like serine/threonine-protein kinase At3g47570 [Camellia sinensis]|uniref:probable LRR receptor-like serine/threonine-protein kinase At3g47570 n=1 Tax=Camellia sinensis TaxID=4442 RepID=UPI001036EA14|nr:probable LRR receptor-like serine/threonine-protein kinase At3g47570 [Camellia sinensis]
MAFPPSTSRIGFGLLQLCYLWSGIYLIVTTTSTNTFVGNETDRLALLAFKTNITQDPHGVMNSWNNSYHFCSNNLVGKFPEELTSLSKPIYLGIHLNNLTRGIPPFIGNLTSLVRITVAYNPFGGSIPDTLGQMKKLSFLGLDVTQLSETLRGIANFDLSHNNFPGKIPTFLEKFALQKLNFSFNDFEGEVPMKGVFTNASAISIIGNYRLCGGISELQLPNCITQKSKHKMSLSHILPITVAFVLKRTTHNTIPVLKELFLTISYEKLFKATDGFSSANLIGFGSFGFVYKGILDQDGEFVAAVKVLNLQNHGAAKSFMAECETLRNIRHRNLVRIITSCSSVDFQGNEFKALVYEFMPNGSLEGWLHSSPKTNNGQNEHRRLNLLERINIAIDVAYALDYLHHQCHTPIIHCDLKPSNILIDHDMVARVGDFGLARFCPELTIPNQSSSIEIRGSIGYVPPGNKFSLPFFYFDICLF